MRRLFAPILISLFLASCGGSKDSAAIKEYKKIVSPACDCKDAECASKIDKAESDWRMKNYLDLSDGDRGAMKKARQDFTKCRDKLLKGSK